MKSTVSILCVMAFISNPVFSASISSSESWDAADLPALTTLAKALTPKGQAAAEAWDLGRHVASRWRTQTPSTDIDWFQWLDLTAAIGLYVPRNVHREICQAALQRYAPTNDAVPALGPSVVAKLCRAATHRYRSLVQELARTWIMSSDKYQSADAFTLAALALALENNPNRGTDPVAEARFCIISYIEKKYMANATATKAVSLDTWGELTAHLACGLSDSDRQRWAASLRNAFAPDTHSLQSMKPFCALGLSDAVLSLEVISPEESVPGLFARQLTVDYVCLSDRWAVNDLYLLWKTAMQLQEAGQTNGTAKSVLRKHLETVRNWQEMSPHELCCYADALACLGGDGRGSRARLAEYIHAVILADSSVIQSIRPLYWHRLVEALASDLTRAEKTYWAERLYASHAQHLAGRLTPSQVEDICCLAQSLRLLGASATAQAESLTATTGAIVFSSADELKAMVSVVDVARLAGSFASFLTEDTRRTWTNVVLDAFTTGPETLSSEDFIDLVEACSRLAPPDMIPQVVDRLAAVVKLEEDASRLRESATVEKLGAWSQLLTVVRGDHPATKATVSYVSSNYLTDASAVTAIPLGQWAIILDAASPTLSYEERLRWADALVEAYLPSLAAGGRLRDRTALRLAHALLRLNDRDSPARRRFVGAATQLWSDAAPPEGALLAMPVFLSEAFTPEERRIWIGLLLSRYAASPSCLSQVPEGIVQHWAATALDRLGSTEMASSLLAAKRTLDTHAVGGRTASEPNRLDAFWWRSLFAAVTAQKPARQSSAWRERLARLAAEEVPFPHEAMTSMAVFVKGLDSDSTLRPAEMIESLLRSAAVDPSTERLLQMALLDLKLAEPNAVPHHLRAVLVDAEKAAPGILRVLGDNVVPVPADRAAETAVPLYEKMIAQLAPEDPLAQLLRQKCLLLILSCNVPDYTHAADHLDALAKASGRLPVDLCDVACQVIFHQVADSAPAARRGLWRESLARVTCRGCQFSPGAENELSRLVSQLSGGDGLASDEVLVDLLLLTPHMTTMQGLQARRVEAASATEGKADASLVRLQAILFMGSVREHDAKRALAPAFCQTFDPAFSRRVAVTASPTSAQVSSGPAASMTSHPPVDDRLRLAAAQALSNSAEDSNVRHVAFLKLWAGNQEEGLADMHAALAAAAVHSRQIYDAFGDLAVAIGICDGHPLQSHRFAWWVSRADGQGLPLDRDDNVLCALANREASLSSAGAETDDPLRLSYAAASPGVRADIGQRAAHAVHQTLVNSAVQAIKGGDSVWADRIWASALAATPIPLVSSTAQSMAEDLRAAGIEAGPAMFLRVADLLKDAERKESILLAGAESLYTEQRFDEYLTYAKQLHAKLPNRGRQVDLRLKEAMAAMSLDRHDEAIAMLLETPSWDCSPQQHAQAGFFIGWIQMKCERLEEAEKTLEGVCADYPNTEAGAKAKALLAEIRVTR